MDGTVEPARMGLRAYWVARGELNGGRFGVADGNLDVCFVRARLTGVDFSGLRFASFFAHDSVFERCDFTRTAFDHADFAGTAYNVGRWDERSWPETVYRECVFFRTRFPPHAHFGNARFERCLFDGARLRGQTSTFEAQFVDCTFRGKVQDVNLWGAPREYHEALGRDRNAFEGNDFTGADLIGVSFRGIDLHAQRFAGLPDYALLDRMDRRAAAVLAAVAGWPDGEIKSELTWWLPYRAGTAVEHNAGHALLSRQHLGLRLPPDVRDQVFWMLVDYSDDQQ